MVIDSLKFIADNESDNDMESNAEDINFLFPDISDDETYTHLINLAIRTGDDPSDETWLPNQTSLMSFGFVQVPPSPSPSPSSNASPIPSSPSHTPDPLEVLEQLPFPSNDGVQIQSDGVYTVGTSGESREADLVEHDPGLIQSIEDAWEDELVEQEHDGVEGAKTLPLSHINQLLLIHNFATLRLQGIGQIKASLEIAHQWDEGEGVYFA
ncbi:hypothetical protein EDC04DRAFT_2903126 [Pisolithus marmoratus]|nr:hypothetical protein EDC04DRAFT_2903126 [Pisolithus marmoratus]